MPEERDVAIQIRKWVTFREDILSDGGRDLERPLRRVVDSLGPRR